MDLIMRPNNKNVGLFTINFVKSAFVSTIVSIVCGIGNSDGFDERFLSK